MRENQRGQKFGTLVFLFAGVTFLILSIAASSVSDRLDSFFERKTHMELEKKLDYAVTFIYPDYFYAKRILDLADLLRIHGSFSPEIDNQFQLMKDCWEIPFQVYIYDHFKFVRSFPHDAQNADLYGKVLRGLTLSGNEFKKVQWELKEEMELYLSSVNRLDLIKHWRGGMTNLHNPGNGSFFCYNFSETLGIFCLFPSHLKPGRRFLKIPSDLRRVLGFADPSESEWVPPKGFTPTQMEIAWKKSQLENPKLVSFAEHKWAFCHDKFGQICCSVKKRSTISRLEGKGLFIVLGGSISFLLFVIFFLALFENSAGLIFARPLNSLPVRYKFYTLFFMASMLPLGLALIVGFVSLTDREELLMAKAQNESTKMIQSLENTRHANYEEFKQFTRQLRDSAMVKEVKVDELASYVTSMVEDQKIKRFEIRDTTGEVIYTNWDPKIFGSMQAIELLAKISIRRHSPNRLGTRAAKISAQELFSESMLTGINTSLTVPMRNPGRVWMFKVANSSPDLWFWDVYPEIASGPAFISVVQILGWGFKEKVLEILNEKWEAGSPLLGMAYLVNDRKFFSSFPEVRGPEAEALVRAGIRSKKTGQTIFRELELDGGKYWVTFKPDLVTSGLRFFHMFPVSWHLEALTPIKLRLAFATLVSLLAAFLASRLLGNLFIEPISDLSAGITAINHRDCTYRIPFRRRDEFGVVVTAFNRLLEELKELEYGRIVQESLLPVAPKVPDGYEFAFFRCPATHLAGDYHDVFYLPDGGWAIIIGDVTGHGISAALAMAMAKATVDYQQISGWSFPTQVLDNLNSLFYRELKPRRKLMTFCSLAIDPIKHQVVYENAGHPYPILFQKQTGEVRDFEMPSYPLGVLKKRHGKPLSLQIEIGDGFLLFTDGLSECTNSAEQQFGFEIINKTFKDLMVKGCSCQIVVQGIRDALDFFRAPGNYPDDVTFLVIKRVS